MTEIQNSVKCYDKKFEKIDNSIRKVDLLLKNEGKAIDDTIIEGDGKVYSFGNKPEKEDKDEEKEDPKEE